MVRCRGERHEHGCTGLGSLLDVLQHAGDGAILLGAFCAVWRW